jgi:hypothetical protein
VSVSPDDTTLSQGGELGYSVTVTNNTGLTGCFRYWTNVTLPDGSRYPPAGELFGPYSVCLDPYDSRTAHLTHAIPLTAPVGTYTYNAFVGPYTEIWDEGNFDFTVTESSVMGGSEKWETTVDKDFSE